MQNNVGFATTFCVPCGGRGVGKAVSPRPAPTLSSPGSQVQRAGPDRLSEGLTLGEPTETRPPSPPQSLFFLLDLIKQT